MSGQVLIENAEKIIRWYHQRVDQFSVGEIVKSGPSDVGVRVECVRRLSSLMLKTGDKTYVFDVPSEIFYSKTPAEPWVMNELNRIEELLVQERLAEEQRQEQEQVRKDLLAMESLISHFPKEAKEFLSAHLVEVGQPFAWEPEEDSQDGSSPS